MEMANNYIAHNYPGPDIKRYSIGSELENGSMGELFIIDDLLDFSNEDIAGPIGENYYSTGSSAVATENLSSESSADRRTFQVPSVLELGAGPGELCVPCDDLAELEWLSNFVEESFSSGDVFPHSSGTLVNTIHHSERNGLELPKEQFQSASPVSVLESSSSSGKIGGFSSEMAVPGRARSKRSRSGVCFWNTRIFSADSMASFLASSSTSTVTANSPLSSDSDGFLQEQSADSLPAKNICVNNESKTKKTQETVQMRKCLHCGIQRTPQWRTGPLGPKTLCNACGVRYKSGRLLPEYRPAASPTFVEAIHSNSHKKVLEMRRQREVQFHMDDVKVGQQMLESKYGNDMIMLDRRDKDM